MSTTDIASAYRTSDAETIEAFREHEEEVRRVQDQRQTLSQSVGGRPLVLRQNGTGTGNHVVGFGFDDADEPTDRPGDLLEDGALIATPNMIVPNARVKAGWRYAQHLKKFNLPDLDIPGMPFSHAEPVEDGHVVYTPALWISRDESLGDVLYAYWQCAEVAVGEHWESIPLSTYWLAYEQHQNSPAEPVAGEVIAGEVVSGNPVDENED